MAKNVYNSLLLNVDNLVLLGVNFVPLCSEYKLCSEFCQLFKSGFNLLNWLFEHWLIQVDHMSNLVKQLRHNCFYCESFSIKNIHKICPLCTKH